MSGRLLVAAGLAVAALIVALLLLLHSPPRSAHAKDDRAPAPRGPALETDSPPRAEAEDDRDPIDRPHTVVVPGKNGRGATILHDHTADPDGGTHLISTLTLSTIRDALNIGIVQCGDGLRKQPNPPSARLLVHAHVRVSHGRVRVETVAIDNGKQLPKDVLDCVARTISKLDTDAPDGQSEGEELLHMPFNVP